MPISPRMPSENFGCQEPSKSASFLKTGIPGCQLLTLFYMPHAKFCDVRTKFSHKFTRYNSNARSGSVLPGFFRGQCQPLAKKLPKYCQLFSPSEKTAKIMPTAQNFLVKTPKIINFLSVIFTGQRFES